MQEGQLRWVYFTNFEDLFNVVRQARNLGNRSSVIFMW